MSAHSLQTLTCMDGQNEDWKFTAAQLQNLAEINRNPPESDYYLKNRIIIEGPFQTQATKI